MNNLSKSRFGITPRQILWIGAAISLILLGLLVWVYYAELQSQTTSFWNDEIVSCIILIPAIGAAIAGTLLTRQFEKGEPPQRIWQAFTIGLWCWVAGEISGMVYDAIYINTPAPDFRLVDMFWLLGYFFLGLSLYYQILLVYGAQKRQGIFLYLGLVVLALLVAAGLTSLTIKAGRGEGYSLVSLFVTVLYPVLDLTEGAIAIWLAFLFGRGQWSRPWWGLILFALTDSIDAFYWVGGYDKIPVVAQSALDVISLVTYPASYMVAGLALLANYFILRYGLTSGWLTSSKKSELNTSGLK
jgi:hypothetical protein